MLFELDRVSVERRGVRVLDDLSGAIPEGVSAVLGPSGSGKTTLLRLLNRLVEPVAGEIRYRGSPLRDRPAIAHRREVGLVPQAPALLEGTVAENVAIGARLAGLEVDADARLREAGLDPGMADRPATRLSVGEGQRLMLARALALSPRVLLLDEPTAALDDASRDVVEAALLGRAEAGLSIVIVTHDRAQARRIAPGSILVLGDVRLEPAPARAGPALR